MHHPSTHSQIPVVIGEGALYSSHRIFRGNGRGQEKGQAVAIRVEALIARAFSAAW